MQEVKPSCCILSYDVEPGSVILNLNPSSSRWSVIDSITKKQ